MDQTKKYRYPGVTPFTTSQASIFFGREQATSDLYRLIRRESLVILYGKSGLGKSSLLNAGIIPRCVKEGEYSPLTIRFGAWTGQSTESPLSICKKALTEGFEAPTLLDRLLPEDASLWTCAKNRQLNTIDQQATGRPLLLFDQFEELFSYPESQVAAFQQELSELLHTGIPLRFRRRLETTASPDEFTEEEEDLLETPLEARIIFAIRSDRMHLLDRLKDYLPNVLRHTFELKALTKADAKDAILLPARAKGDFQTPDFEYSPEALSHLLGFLEDPQDQRIEGILLQMLCEHYERRQVEANGTTLLDLPQIGDPKQVVKKYYNEKIEGLPTGQQTAARRLIEEGLVSEGEAMRLSLHESYIEHEFGVEKGLLEELVDSRLLRSEPFLRGGYTYELSHDRLVSPVLQARSQRREEEARRAAEKQANELDAARKRVQTLRGLLAIALLAFVVAGYFAWNANSRKVETENAKSETQNALNKANTLINAFYFYADRFAIAYGPKGQLNKNVFYFIDKTGTEVTKLGQWEKAEQFEGTGFAKVKKQENGKLVDYLLDTLGNSYRVAYDLKSITPQITALDLSNEQWDSFPIEVLLHPQLQVLILNGNFFQKNSFRTIPVEIAKLSNLRSLQLAYGNLESLPAEIGQLTNLSTLDLSDNQLSSLPAEIGQLTNLSTLYLSDNPISEAEQEKIKKLLPNSWVSF